MSAPTPAPGDDRPREGYYPDPSIPGYVRYWNGAAWVPGTSRPAPSDGLPLGAPGGPSQPGGPGQPGQLGGPGQPGQLGGPGQPGQLGQSGQSGQSVEETGPHFFDEDPAPDNRVTPADAQHGSRPEPAAAWGADRAHQSGFGGDQDRRVSWGAPDPRVPADTPAQHEEPSNPGTFVFRRPTPGPDTPDEGTTTFRRPTPRTPQQGGAPGAQAGSTGNTDSASAGTASGFGPQGPGGSVAGGYGSPGSPGAGPGVGGFGAQGPGGSASGAGGVGPQGSAGSGRQGSGGSGAEGYGAGSAAGTGSAGGGYGSQGSPGAGPGVGGFGAQGPGGSGSGPGGVGSQGSAGSGAEGYGARGAAGTGSAGGGYGPQGSPGVGGVGPQGSAGPGRQGPGGSGSAGSAGDPSGPGFGAGKAAAVRAAQAQTGQAGIGAGAPAASTALSGPQQPAPAVPQQSGPVQQPQAAVATPMASGVGGGQPSWAQQVHRLAGDEDGPVAPWKPPVEDVFQAAARRQSEARPAGLGKRLLARLVDTVVLAAVTAVAAVPLGTRAADHINEKIDAAKLSGRSETVWLLDGTTAVYLGIVLAVLLLFGVLYEALPTAKWGRTLGKKLCGLEVRGIESHEPPGFGGALRRWLVYSVPGLLGIGIVGVAWCLFDRPWHQCWHDKAAHTFVAG
jgi:uncharacterized RDD family membrane protein YckC